MEELKKGEDLMVFNTGAARNRRYYKITPAGLVQLNLYRTEWKSYSSKITQLFDREEMSQ